MASSIRFGGNSEVEKDFVVNSVLPIARVVMMIVAAVSLFFFIETPSAWRLANTLIFSILAWDVHIIGHNMSAIRANPLVDWACDAHQNFARHQVTQNTILLGSVLRIVSQWNV